MKCVRCKNCILNFLSAHLWKFVVLAGVIQLMVYAGNHYKNPKVNSKPTRFLVTTRTIRSFQPVTVRTTESRAILHSTPASANLTDDMGKNTNITDKKSFGNEPEIVSSTNETYKDIFHNTPTFGGMDTNMNMSEKTLFQDKIEDMHNNIDTSQSTAYSRQSFDHIRGDVGTNMNIYKKSVMPIKLEKESNLTDLNHNTTHLGNASSREDKRGDNPNKYNKRAITNEQHTMPVYNETSSMSKGNSIKEPDNIGITTSMNMSALSLVKQMPVILVNNGSSTHTKTSNVPVNNKITKITRLQNISMNNQTMNDTNLQNISVYNKTIKDTKLLNISVNNDITNDNRLLNISVNNETTRSTEVLHFPMNNKTTKTSIQNASEASINKQLTSSAKNITKIDTWNKSMLKNISSKIKFNVPSVDMNMTQLKEKGSKMQMKLMNTLHKSLNKTFTKLVSLSGNILRNSKSSKGNVKVLSIENSIGDTNWYASNDNSKTKKVTEPGNLSSAVIPTKHIPSVTKYKRLKHLRCSPGIPCEYENQVDVRLIVITFNRPGSLQQCLTSLQKLVTDNAKAVLEIWIDVDKNGKVHEEVVDVAKGFRWQHGPVRVTIQEEHAGIMGQWIDTWRPLQEKTKEIALILEDDIDVSPYAIRWLRAAHAQYNSRSDVAGYSLSEVDIVDSKRRPINLPKENIFMFQRLGTFGFSPHPKIWMKFQDWFHAKRKASTSFRPYVPGDMLMTRTYAILVSQGRPDTMWSMWFEYYTYNNNAWTVFPNIGAHLKNIYHIKWDNSTMAFHREEKGLHFYKKTIRKSSGRLLTHWNNTFVKFPEKISKYDCQGHFVSSI